MKQCPNCKRTFNDEALNFCLADGSPLAPLVIDAPSLETDSTTRYPVAPDTNPPQTEVYRPPATVANQPPPVVPQWSPMPPAQAPRKSHAVWWILGGIAIAIFGAGLVVVLIVIGVLTSESNTISNTNSNTIANKNMNRSNANNANSSNANTNASSSLPASLSDDFSTKKWGTGSSQFGDFWYTDDEYHMRAKEPTYLMMYGPSNDYNTENATVRVTVRNVDGVSPRSGYGLVVHCAKKAEKFEYYTFLIYTNEKPRYKVGMYKGGDQTPLVEWTESNVVRTGTNTNQLEVRIKGSELSFYVNSQRLTSITDTAGFKRGLVGFYTSDAHEVAFDDLQITR